MANLSMALSSTCNVYTVVFNRQGLHEYPLGGELISLEVYPGRTWVSKIFAFWRRVRRLKQIKSKRHIDVSISFLEGADYVNILSRYRDKVVISIRGSKYSDQMIKGPIGFLRKNVLMPLLYKRAGGIVCVSEGIRREILGMGISPGNVKTIYNFYEANYTRGSTSFPTKYSLFDGAEYILSVGRLHPQKNFNASIDIFAGVLSTNSNLKLLLVGDGPEMATLVQHARNLRLRVFEPEMDINPTYDVYFLGYQEPFCFLRRAKLFLLTSAWEGFPNVLLEAMDCEVPIIAADCNFGPREMLLTTADKISPLTYPVIGTAGVLMPVPASQDAIRHWIRVTNGMLDDLELRKKLVTGGSTRLGSFNRSRIISEWINVINET
jgi:glycosyltransferase involved in cell wall biosynthesis